MEDKGVYTVNNGYEPELEALLEKGRKILEEDNRNKRIDQDIERERISREWKDIEKMVTATWPWIKKYISSSENARLRFPSRSACGEQIYIEVQGLATMAIKVFWNFGTDKWELEEDSAICVFQISNDINSQWVIGKRPTRFDIDDMHIALAVAEDRGKEFEARTKEYQTRVKEHQESIDIQQSNELKVENALPEKRITDAIREMIQNVICENCSTCA